MVLIAIADSHRHENTAIHCAQFDDTSWNSAQNIVVVKLPKVMGRLPGAAEDKIGDVSIKLHNAGVNSVLGSYRAHKATSGGIKLNRRSADESRQSLIYLVSSATRGGRAKWSAFYNSKVHRNRYSRLFLSHLSKMSRQKAALTPGPLMTSFHFKLFEQ